jgi:Tfp pilus assembly protein PilN
MALRINLYHEVLRTRKQQQYDPLKLAMMGVIIIAIVLVGWYVVELGSRSTAVSAYNRQKALLDELAPQEAAAKEQEASISQKIALVEKLAKRIEERFYWAPVFEDLATVVPPSVQITKLGAEISGEGLRKVQISMEGIAAGDEPRATAEDFRTALTERMSKKFKNAAANFKTLDEAAEAVSLDGRTLRTALFNITLSFTTGTEPPPPPPVRKRVPKIAQQEGAPQ